MTKRYMEVKKDSSLFQEHRPEQLTERLKAEFLFSLSETLKGLSSTENLKASAVKLEPYFKDLIKYEKPMKKGFCEVSSCLELSKSAVRFRVNLYN